MSVPSSADRDAFWLRAGLAFVWLATGLGIFHPEYREIGARYLQKLHLHPVVMEVTCLFEMLLGLRVLLGRTAAWLAGLQAAMIVTFTALLGWIEPRMLADPFGVLTKNVPLLAIVVTQWLLEREGWTPRALWVLRSGMASIWLLEGLLPAILFQRPELREVLEYYGLSFGHPVLVLRVTGALQAMSAMLALTPRGWVLRVVVACQVLGLVAICVLVTVYRPLLLVHPFGPVTKNVPILIGTLVVFRRVSQARGEEPCSN